MTLTTPPSWTVRGLGGRRAEPARAEIPARVVPAPVATTVASPMPWTTKVPAMRASPSWWRTASLSPVTSDSSTVRA